MRVCFLLPELGRSGGAGVVSGYVERLRARGWDAEVLLSGDPDAREWDFAFATWWETAPALWSLRARRRGVLLQSLEERFYGEHEVLRRFGAASVLALPVDYVAISGWIRDALAGLRPEARCAVVRNGIDKSVFAPAAEPRAARSDGPLRVLVEGNPDMWLKAIPEAVAVVRAMREPAELTVAAPFPERAAALGADRVTGGLDAAGMAALYSDHDVLVKLSRVEGLGLPAIEAMHVGTPVVITPYGGHDEYLRHRENGLLVGFDDPAAATAALDELAGDRELLARLSDGALRTAAEWPSWDEATDALATAIEDFVAAPPPAVEPALAALAGRQRLAIELGQVQLGQLAWAERARDELAQALIESRAELDRRLADKDRELAAVRQERAYRAAVRARGLLHRVTRP